MLNAKDRTKLQNFLKVAKHVRMFRFRNFTINNNFEMVEFGTKKLAVNNGSFFDSFEIGEDTWDDFQASMFAAKNDLREDYENKQFFKRVAQVF